MFHAHVMNAAGRRVDIGRAQFLMDKQIAQQAAEWVDANIDTLRHNHNGREPCEGTKNQAFWDYYCERHFEKYGTSFEPNVNPDWN